jgi:hypothetical protein
MLLRMFIGMITNVNKMVSSGDYRPGRLLRRTRSESGGFIAIWSLRSQRQGRHEFQFSPAACRKQYFWSLLVHIDILSGSAVVEYDVKLFGISRVYIGSNQVAAMFAQRSSQG